uniref:Malectin-like domain-containing protein n=1 Tax=Leersia perrieri TaxID=77586 RepID=A0A0D9XCV2_9ORYZ
MAATEQQQVIPPPGLAPGPPRPLALCSGQANSALEPQGAITSRKPTHFMAVPPNHKVAADNQVGGLRPDLTVRSFPTGVRNCYSLPTVAGTKYLVRVIAFYGNYDGKNSSSALQYDLYLGVNYWITVTAVIGSEVYEAIFVAWASWAPVCLINTGGGTPFISTVELRPLADGIYQEVMANQSMSKFDRRGSEPLAKTVAVAPRRPSA